MSSEAESDGQTKTMSKEAMDFMTYSLYIVSNCFVLAC